MIQEIKKIKRIRNQKWKIRGSRRVLHDQCGARVHDKITDTKKRIQRTKEDNQIEDQMKKDHFGINVEREYRINHGRKANQTRMSKN